MFPILKKALPADGKLVRTVQGSSVIRWIVSIALFVSCFLTLAAPGASPQIQGRNLRIEFDNHLRTRVIARFDKMETVMGPFTDSETVTTVRQALDGISR